MNHVLLGVFAYVAAQLAIGIWMTRRNRTEADYLLAGRSFGLGLATFSFFATWFGAETCIGAAGKVYEHGLAGMSSDPFGYGVCLVLMGLVFAVPLRRGNYTTLGDFFRARFSPGVEKLTVVLMIPASLLWAAAQMRAFGQVLDVTAGFGITAGILIGAGVAIVYTASGGLRADVMTDLVQGIAIVLGLGWLGIVMAQHMGGPADALSTVPAERLQLRDADWPNTLEAWAVPIIGSITAQELAARAFACRSHQVARRAALAGGALYVLVGLVPVLVGLLGPTLIPDLQEPEQLLPLVAQQHLPTFFYVLFAGALVSAILSTVDSTLLAASALATHNLIIPRRPGMREAARLRLSKLGVVGAGLVALGFAFSADTIFELVQTASAFGSAGIFVAMAFGIFTRFGGARSAAAALVAGTAVWAVGTHVLEIPCAYLVSLGTAFLAYLAVAVLSRWTPSRRDTATSPR
jgi:Na+/proline symporter